LQKVVIGNNCRGPASEDEPTQARGRPRKPILVVEDDDGIREMIIVVLTDAGYATRDATTGEEALEIASEDPPELVVLDVVLPGICGYEVCYALRMRFGDELPIVFISGERTQAHERVAGFMVGGDDYLVKPFALDEFLARVRRLLQRTKSSATARGLTLTNRELEVLRLLAEGMSQAEIATSLYISPRTVATHTERIFKKLGVHSRARAIAFAYREHVLTSR